MLRSLYRRLLRLHPPSFRKRFAEEILSILDQAAECQARFKLLGDGLVSLARQWALRPEFWCDISPAPTAETASDGIPSFYTLDPFRPRTAAVVHGLLLTAVVFCLTCFAIRYSWITCCTCIFRKRSLKVLHRLRSMRWRRCRRRNRRLHHARREPHRTASRGLCDLRHLAKSRRRAHYRSQSYRRTAKASRAQPLPGAPPT